MKFVENSSRIVAIFAMILFPFCTASRSLAVPSGGDDSDPELLQLARQYNWILYVDGSRIKNFMRYEGSGLDPVDQFAVTFQQTAAAYVVRGVEAPRFQPFHYEEFWYHAGTPIGLRRRRDVPMPERLQGAIYFRGIDNDAINNSSAIADCAMRLAVESSAQGALVAAVVVPKDCFEQISSAFGKFGFYPAEQITFDASAGSGGTSLRLVSNPPGEDRSFVYMQ